MSEECPQLRVLVADEDRSWVDKAASVISELGYQVVARAIRAEEIPGATAAERADVAVVGVGENSQHALRLIDLIVRSSTCPVIAVIRSRGADFVREAARRGIFAYVSDDRPDELRSTIEVVLHRFAEFQSLEGAIGRRAITERAKGILTERHGIERAAFDRLRQHARATNRRLVDVAEAVADTHLLFREAPPAPGGPCGEPA